MLKKIGIALVATVALLLIVAAFAPKEMNSEKTVKIDAPQEIVWRHVSSMKGMDSWSPWNDYEPDMNKEWSGTSGSVGDKMT
ncbi:hypothetical protein N8368_03000 [Bacteroidia bacterium]|nr:hypothetical protein [Bacteroidia bacterium]MDB9882587.1 hypothetical protein [Bacteroidia bacterium]MDC1395456.1 hypothetical protein [Bacteroidia bacterium]